MIQSWYKRAQDSTITYLAKDNSAHRHRVIASPFEYYHVHNEQSSRYKSWYKLAQEEQQEQLEFPEIQNLFPSKEEIAEEKRQIAEEKRQSVADINPYAAQVLEEFVRSAPGDKQSWTLVPFGRVKKIWNDYMKFGFVRDENGMQKISDIILKNIYRLYANTYLCGHTQNDPEEFFDAFGIDEENRQRFWWEYVSDENGQDRISDYAMDDLMQDAYELESAATAEEQLQIVDRVFNRIHERNDLPAMFIEGGTKSLNELAGRPSKAETTSWGKQASIDDLPDYVQKMFGLGKYRPKRKYKTCPKCKKQTAYYKEMHPDTDMNEMVLYCETCGEIE